MTSKRFVILVDSETSEQVRKLIEEFKTRRLGFWHWLKNSYLVVDKKGTETSGSLRDLLQETHKGIHSLVLELRGDDTYAGFGPRGEKRDMFKWVRDVWKPAQ